MTNRRRSKSEGIRFVEGVARRFLRNMMAQGLKRPAYLDNYEQVREEIIANYLDRLDGEGRYILNEQQFNKTVDNIVDKASKAGQDSIIDFLRYIDQINKKNK